MANPLIDVDIGNPDPDECPMTITELVAILRPLITAELQGSYMPYVVGQDTPGVDDQDKIWHRFDGAGRPIGHYKFYSGIWRRFYTGLLGEIRHYDGDPAVDFDGTGLGIVGGEFDGWALCNGNNGTRNRSNTFIAGANMDSQGGGGQYSAGGNWQSFVDGKTILESGGAFEHMIINGELPNMRVKANGFAIQNGANTGEARILIDDDYDTNKPRSQTIANFGADPVPEDPEATPVPQIAVPITPKFDSAAVIQFVGYI